MTRSVYVKTACGCQMPGLLKAVERDRFERDAEARVLAKRRKPVRTTVAAYVDRKSPALARKLNKTLTALGKATAAKLKKLYAERLAKDAGPKRDIIASILEDLDSQDMGQTLEGDLAPAMLAAFRKAAAHGVAQVGFSMDGDMTKQVDQRAVDYAAEHGGELITDLAGTTDEFMRDLLARAVSEGMSPDELSDEVLDSGAFSESRADMIARTELAFAHVQGNKAGWEATGQVVGKRSVLGDNHEVDDICDEAADAGVVDINAEFVDGASDPPYHPNCVCDIEPVLSEDDDSDQAA